jgi:hypothetical protein
MAALTTQQKLDAAEAAYHDLITGRSARVVVDDDGVRVEYTATNAARLQAYIQSLRDALYGTSTARTRGPLSVYF